MVTRIPPHSEQTEQAIIGAAMSSGFTNKVIEAAMRHQMSGDWFYTPSLRLMWAAVISLITDGSHVDPLTLSEYLTQTGQLDNIGGSTQVDKCIDSCHAPSHFVHYIEILQDRYRKRLLLSAILDKEEELYSKRPAVEIVSDLSVTLANCRKQTIQKKTFHQIVGELTEKYRHARNKGFHGLPHYLHSIQHTTGGLPLKETWFLAARPSVGKTTMLLNQVKFLAGEGIPCGIISLEMSETRLIERMIGAESGLNIASMERGNMTAEDEKRFMAAASILQQLPIHIRDGSMAIEGVRSAARDLVSEHEIQFLGIDYIQLIRSSVRRNSRNEEVSYWSNNLVTDAKELGYHQWIVSQLSRPAKGKETTPPTLSDLRDSGALEQDADLVAFLHPDWENDSIDKNTWQGNMELPSVCAIGKARYGLTGSPRIPIVFLKREQRFVTTASEIEMEFTGDPF